MDWKMNLIMKKNKNNDKDLKRIAESANKKKPVKTFLIGFVNLDSRDKITCVINRDDNTVDIDKTAVIVGEEAKELYDKIKRLSAKSIKKN